MYKYESIFTYSGDVTGEEECCPLTYLLDEDCYSFVKSMYEEAIRDGTLEEDVESQEELFGEDYESHMTIYKYESFGEDYESHMTNILN